MPNRSNEKVLYKSKIFTIKSVDLDFNGKIHTHEYLDKSESVMVVPLEDDHVYLIKEYFTAIDKYEYCLPKGRLDKGHTPEQCADKELQEEIGKKAKNLVRLPTLTLSPGYNSQHTHIFIATGFTDSKLPGDEPEELEVHKVPLSQINQLIQSGQITESRTIAAISMAKIHFENYGQIHLKEMEFFGHHGVLDSEKENGQNFIVNLTLWADTQKAQENDTLNDTINYAEVYEQVKTFFTDHRYDLIEKLAEEILNHLLKTFKIYKAQITIDKPQVPIQGKLKSTAVTITKYK